MELAIYITLGVTEIVVTLCAVFGVVIIMSNLNKLDERLNEQDEMMAEILNIVENMDGGNNSYDNTIGKEEE